MADTERIKTLLGFARRAGKMAVGRSAVEMAYKQNKLVLTILAEDATPKAERVVAHCKGTGLVRYSTKDGLGAILGRDEVGMVGILDQGFAVSLKQAITS